jgi:hypothetical protein
LEVDDPHNAHNGDESADDESQHQNDFLPELHSQRRKNWEREDQDGDVSEDVDWGRREVERDDVDARPLDGWGEGGNHRATLEYAEEGENDTGNVDHGHGRERGVAKERVSSPHAVVENQN